MSRWKGAYLRAYGRQRAPRVGLSGSGAENSSEIQRVFGCKLFGTVLSQAPVVVHMLSENLIPHIELHAGVSGRIFEKIISLERPTEGLQDWKVSCQNDVIVTNFDVSVLRHGGVLVRTTRRMSTHRPLWPR